MRTGTWPVLTAACLAEQVYMTIVTYSMSSGIVRRQVGKPEGWGQTGVSPGPGLVPSRGRLCSQRILFLSMDQAAAQGPSFNLLCPPVAPNRLPQPSLALSSVISSP